MKRKAIQLSMAFVAGLIAGVLAAYLYFDYSAKVEQVEREAGQAKEDQFVCVEFHIAALYQRARLYRQKMGYWPTNVQALVETQLLPAVSQVHLCPSQIRLAGGNENLAGFHTGDFSFIDLQQPKVMGSYSNSPYRLRVTDKFTVTCGCNKSHTRRVLYDMQPLD